MFTFQFWLEYMYAHASISLVLLSLMLPVLWELDLIQAAAYLLLHHRRHLMSGYPIFSVKTDLRAQV